VVGFRGGEGLGGWERWYGGFTEGNAWSGLVNPSFSRAKIGSDNLAAFLSRPKLERSETTGPPSSSLFLSDLMGSNLSSRNTNLLQRRKARSQLHLKDLSRMRR